MSCLSLSTSILAARNVGCFDWCAVVPITCPSAHLVVVMLVDSVHLYWLTHFPTSSWSSFVQIILKVPSCIHFCFIVRWVHHYVLVVYVSIFFHDASDLNWILYILALLFQHNETTNLQISIINSFVVRSFSSNFIVTGYNPL